MTQASLDAYISIAEALPEKRRRVYEVVVRYTKHDGDTNDGATIGEVCAALELGNQLHLVSPRLTELKRLGLVYDAGVRREGQTVWRAVQDPPLLLRFNPVPKKRVYSAKVAGYQQSYSHGPTGNRYTVTLEFDEPVPELSEVDAHARVRLVVA